jgi:hypothetical protein|tara:strand:+ start:1506 stop:1976 length:471 start_codon:yes stop_codon:yes gene_type:complete
MTSEEILEEIKEAQKKDTEYVGRCVRGLKLNYQDPNMPNINLCPNLFIIKAYASGTEHNAQGHCPIECLSEKYPELFSLEKKDWFKKPDLHFYSKMKEVYPEVYEEKLAAEEDYKRVTAYSEIDKDLLEALAEKEEGRPEKMVEYLEKRKKVKESF